MEITQFKFAELMGMKGQQARQLIQGKLQITQEIVEKLEEVLRIPAPFWINREKAYREKLGDIEAREAALKIILDN